jgi:hypothetical protein
MQNVWGRDDPEEPGATLRGWSPDIGVVAFGFDRVLILDSLRRASLNGRLFDHLGHCRKGVLVPDM